MELREMYYVSFNSPIGSVVIHGSDIPQGVSVYGNRAIAVGLTHHYTVCGTNEKLTAFENYNKDAIAKGKLVIELIEAREAKANAG